MAQREFDLVIFGATGFTGKNTIPPVYNLTRTRENLKWAIAGRSESKLHAILKEMGSKIGVDLGKIPVIIADVTDEESLKKMATKTRIILNTAGPYRFYGEAVVKACIESGTHHVDVSGEPQYMETMQLKYHDAAKQKRVYVVSACGYDSIPADLGICFLENHFRGTLNSVESYLEFQDTARVSGVSANTGTWESAIYATAHDGEIAKINKQLFPISLPTFKPKLGLRLNPHKKFATAGYALPFLGPDKSVALRSQRYFYETENKRPIQVETYFCVQSLFAVALYMFYGLIFGIFAKFSYGRKLLLNYPELFSAGIFGKNGPSEEKMNGQSFTLRLIGEGWPEKLTAEDEQFTRKPCLKIIGEVTGPNPAYGSTTIALVQAAITILEEHEKLPKGGGVYPPGAAFAKTSLVENLNKLGLTYKIIDVKKI